MSSQRCDEQAHTMKQINETSRMSERKNGKLNANNIVQSTTKAIMEYVVWYILLLCLKFIEIHSGDTYTCKESKIKKNDSSTHKIHSHSQL